MAHAFEHSVEVVAARSHGQDRAVVFETAHGIIVALADGAGGTGNGAVAAQAIVDAVAAAGDGAEWSALLSSLDHDPKRVGLGQSTAVLLTIDERGIAGASVGDSGAWLISSAEIEDITEGQARKPLVGDGCTPFAISIGPLADRTLLVASDGLLRYAKPADIAAIALGPDLRLAARALVELVRLPSGGLQDDVAVVLCRRAIATDRTFPQDLLDPIAPV